MRWSGLGFALAICFRRKDMEVNKPELLVNRGQVKAVNYTNALDDTMRITRILPSNQFYSSGMPLVQNHIIKDDISIRGLGKQRAHFLPQQTGRGEIGAGVYGKSWGKSYVVRIKYMVVVIY